MRGQRLNCPTTRGVGLGADTRYSTQTNVTEDLSLNLQMERHRPRRAQFRRPEDRLDGRELRQQLEQQDRHRPLPRYQRRQADSSSSVARRATASQPVASPIRRISSTNGRWNMRKTAPATNSPYRLDADIKLSEDGWADSLRVGVRRAERDQNVNWSTYNWGAVQPLWGVQGDVPTSSSTRLRGRAPTTRKISGPTSWAAASSAAARSCIRASTS